MKLLIIGASSFVARDLPATLSDAGHEVFVFQRGTNGLNGRVLSGRLDRLDELASIAGNFDAVVNFAVLKEADVAANLAAVEGILRFCRKAGVKRLVQISSISVYDSRVQQVSEISPVEPNAASKGAYAALKIAVDQYILEHKGQEPFETVLVRPGFVLGQGIANPFPGMGFRLPFNRLLLFGGGSAQIPLVSREYVVRLLLQVLELPDVEDMEVFHAFDPTSGSRREYVEACHQHLGIGRKVWRFPACLWAFAGFFLDMLLRMLRKDPMFLRSLKNSSSNQFFSAAKTEARLGISERVETESFLKSCFPDQKSGFIPPAIDTLSKDLPMPCNMTVIGTGRIIRTAHFEAWKLLSWDKREAQFYDVRASSEVFGEVRELAEGSFVGEGFYVVASPAIYHRAAADLLTKAEGHCLVEKPLALNRDEWRKWETIADEGKMVVGVCHNYRFKKNMRQFRECLNKHPSGRLLGANLVFQSPPVKNDDSPWIRRERESRSLLLDYGIHFLDAACLFDRKSWSIEGVEWEIDLNGDTRLIRGRCASESYGLNFHLQQGFGPRTCRIEYIFANYTAVVSFFPDSFHVRMANHGAGTALIETSACLGGTKDKILEKLRGCGGDGSHAFCYDDLINKRESSELSVRNLRGFYHLLFDLEERIYD